MEQLILHFNHYVLQQSNSIHTQKQYRLDMNHFMKKMNVTAIEQFEQAVLSYKTTLDKERYSIPTINRKLASLKKFLYFLQTMGNTQFTHLLDIAELKPDSIDLGELMSLTAYQLQQVLQFWQMKAQSSVTMEHQWLAMRNEVIVHFIKETAIKPAELVRIQWLNIEQESAQITGTRSGRTVKISPKLQQLLNTYLEETRTFMPDSEVSPYVWLGVRNKRGKPITTKTIERLFASMSKELNFKVTATMLRYYSIGAMDVTQMQKNTEEYGYARKSVLTERQNRMPRDNNKLLERSCHSITD